MFLYYSLLFLWQASIAPNNETVAQPGFIIDAITEEVPLLMAELHTIN